MYQRHVFCVNDGAVVCMPGLQSVRQGWLDSGLPGNLEIGNFTAIAGKMSAPQERHVVVQASSLQNSRLCGMRTKLVISFPACAVLPPELGYRASRRGKKGVWVKGSLSKAA